MKTTSKDIKDSTQAAKDRWLNIFIQLSDSERFNDFVSRNFKIVDSVNHEEKTIETLVVESPLACGPPLEPEQVIAIRMALGKIKNAKKIAEKIFKILGQEDISRIELVTSIK